MRRMIAKNSRSLLFQNKPLITFTKRFRGWFAIYDTNSRIREISSNTTFAKSVRINLSTCKRKSKAICSTFIISFRTVSDTMTFLEFIRVRTICALSFIILIRAGRDSVVANSVLKKKARLTLNASLIYLIPLFTAFRNTNSVLSHFPTIRALVATFSIPLDTPFRGLSTWNALAGGVFASTVVPH